MKVTIIGGGIIGLCCAYYLTDVGIEVEVFDKTDLSDGCSFGNAGMIVPSHFTPMATPGIISKGIRWMFDSKSPFYIKPRLDPSLIQWLWKFYRSCNSSKVEAAIPALRDLSFLSKQLYQEMTQQQGFDFQYEEEGLIMLYKSKKAEKEEIETAEKANSIGVEAKILSAEAVRKYETGTETDIIGGVFYPGDAHLYPNVLMRQLISYLKKKGVRFFGNTEVTGFEYDKKIKSLITKKQEKHAVDQLVISGGSWTPKVLKFLGIKMLMQDGKGYSITINDQKEKPRIPAILTEAKVAITPMGNDLRIGGTLEISNMSTRINKNRLAGILESVPNYYPKINPTFPDLKKVWHGFRPCTPDGLPYIGQSQQYENLTIATGHAMMGLSLGPATGKVISEMLLKQPASVETNLFDPHRF